MGFTTPCFIRKNTTELQEKLKNIGYRSLDNDNDKRDGLVADRNGFMYSIFEKNVLGSTYNCGTNEELFLAIAALRDDTSANQYWIFDQDFPPHYKKGDFTIGYFNRCSCYCHVATVNELIEHFKEKK
jgi:hypothetical protein